MSDNPSTSAVDKRRQQAQERRRKRTALNLHYMEEEAVRALETGSLQPQRLLVSVGFLEQIARLAEGLGADEEVVLNQAICLASTLLRDGRITLDDLKSSLHFSRLRIRFGNATLLTFKPTSETVRVILRAGDKDASSIYAMAGVTLLFEGIQHARRNQREILIGPIKTRRR